MSEKTVVAGVDHEEHFAFAEDYLLFGMLVRHGLCKPTDYALLVAAQNQTQPKPTLLKLLSDSSKLPERSRTDMQELLNVLSEPKLRKLLPAELPPVATILPKTIVEEETLGVVSPGEAPTVVSLTQGPSLGSRASGITQLDKTLSATHLTQDEVQRLEGARKKGPMIGKVVVGHIVLDKLGGGGQGDVFLAKQTSLNRYVALKKLEIPHLSQAERFLSAFRAEAQTLGSLNHAGIVKVYDIFQEDTAAFFTMEHINGRTIRDIVKDAGPMPLEVVANLACQACNALALTAEQNLIHRDIKPANMMVDQNGDLKIVDFGLASAAAGLVAGPAQFSGTPAYASPEQAELAANLTPASDQYALGLTLYYALTGQQAISGSSVSDMLFKQVSVMPPAPSKVVEALPSSVDRLIMKMLAKKPAERFASFDECYSAWADVLRSATASRSVVDAKQLLGAGLLRLGREEAGGLWQRGAILAAAWVVFAIGVSLADAGLKRSDAGLAFMDFCGTWGSWLLVFSLSCIAYVAAVRRKLLPVVGSVRGWLITHISTAIPAVAMLILHSGHFTRGMMPGGGRAPVLLTALLGLVMLATAISGTAGLLIFRALRRQLQLQELNLRGAKLDPTESMRLALGAELLSGWRLVHYPLAVFMVALALLHIYESLRLTGS